MQLFPSQLVFRPSVAARKAAGPDLGKVARLALEAVLKNGRSLEIAHQQITYGNSHFALSSRIGSGGQLILELDIGNPALADRIILEQDLKGAERANGMIQSPKPGGRWK
jgi:hypothetical protein